MNNSAFRVLSMTTMGKRLARALDARSMGAPALIAAIHSSKGTVYNILDDTTKPEKVRAVTAAAICHALGISQSWFLSGQGSMGASKEGRGLMGHGASAQKSDSTELDPALLRSAIFVTERAFAAKQVTVTAEARAEITLAAYDVLREGQDMQSAQRIVARMLQAIGGATITN